jgi:ATP-dependent DNA ligase
VESPAPHTNFRYSLQHLLSRRHQKFAADDGNFVVIDELINRLQRPSGRWTAPSFFSYEHAEPPVDANTYDLPQAIREDLLKLPAIEARQQLQAYVQSAEADRRENRRLEARKISDENWDLYR